MKNRIMIAILTCIVASIFIGLAIIIFPKESAIIQEDKLLITTSFYPLSDFAQKIAGDKAQVINITPAGSEPHDFEPTPQDLATIYKSDLFIYNGINLESWADKVVEGIKDTPVKILLATKEIETIGTGNNADPHVWIDPVLAQKIALSIRDSLIEIDPANKELYSRNTDSLIVKLIDLDQKYSRALHECKQQDLVTSHEALGYLSKRYGFTDFSISGMSPDEEPSAKKMSELVDLIRLKKVKYVLTEKLVSPKLAETISAEAGASTLGFNPVEGLTPQELDNGEDYFSVQYENINSLSKALECQTN